MRLREHVGGAVVRAAARRERLPKELQVGGPIAAAAFAGTAGSRRLGGSECIDQIACRRQEGTGILALSLG